MSFIFLCTNQDLNITIMTKKVSYVTKEGLKKLQDELDNLQNVERPKISKAIGEAIEKGDISENAEYDAGERCPGIAGG